MIAVAETHYSQQTTLWFSMLYTPRQKAQNLPLLLMINIQYSFVPEYFTSGLCVHNLIPSRYVEQTIRFSKEFNMAENCL